MIEGFASARKQIHAAIRLDGDSAVSVQLDFLCGVQRYVALTLIGKPATRNFAESTT